MKTEPNKAMEPTPVHGVDPADAGTRRLPSWLIFDVSPLRAPPVKTAEQTEIKPSDLTFRWVHGYYDGILSGFAIFHGGLCYFHVSDDSGNRRSFTIHSLSDEEARKAIRDYEEFKALHGDHNDLLPDGTHAGGTCHATLEDAAAAGDAFAAGRSQPLIPYHLSPIVGWFTSTTF